MSENQIANHLRAIESQPWSVVRSAHLRIPMRNTSLRGGDSCVPRCLNHWIRSAPLFPLIIRSRIDFGATFACGKKVWFAVAKADVSLSLSPFSPLPFPSFCCGPFPKPSWSARWIFWLYSVYVNSTTVTNNFFIEYSHITRYVTQMQWLYRDLAIFKYKTTYT